MNDIAMIPGAMTLDGWAAIYRGAAPCLAVVAGQEAVTHRGRGGGLATAQWQQHADLQRRAIAAA